MFFMHDTLHRTMMQPRIINEKRKPMIQMKTRPMMDEVDELSKKDIFCFVVLLMLKIIFEQTETQKKKSTLSDLLVVVVAANDLSSTTEIIGSDINHTK